MPEAQFATIVLIEDDPGHARLIEKNLRRAKIANQIVHLEDGEQALSFFYGAEKTRPSLPPPTTLLVLLDLNLPRVSGFDVLARLKSDPRTKRIPVVVLTTTDDMGEVARCYELGCNVYVTKPVEYHQFAEAIRKLGDIFSVATLPDIEGACP